MLAGGGARGAYEVGALAALAPALSARGETLDIIVGTSIGALNGAFLAARAGEPLQAAADAAHQMWRELGWGDALRPLVSPYELGRLLSAGAMLAGVPGADLPGLLDPSPLRGTLGRLVNFRQIARNVEDGARPRPLSSRPITPEHRALSSIMGPALGLDRCARSTTPRLRSRLNTCSRRPRSRGAFRSVEVDGRARLAGRHGDGGVRLNAPLSPALALGADRVLVIGSNPSATRARASARPDALDGVAQLLQVALADQLADNIATLASVNESLTAAGSSADGTWAAPSAST